jgi:hypothetical protein
MALYIALHTPKRNPEEAQEYFRKITPDFAVAMADGKTPARCLKTWNPYAHGNKDYVFCLWEAEKPEDVMNSLDGLVDYVNTDLMPVDEIDWAQIARDVKERTPVTADR